MSKLQWTAEAVFGLPGMPDWANYAAIDELDESGAFYYYITAPLRDDKNRVWHSLNDDFSNRICLRTNYTGDWKDSLLKRPVKIEVGMFGEFWDKEKIGLYGYLKEVCIGLGCPYESYWMSYYKNFEPIDPKTLPAKRGE